MAPKKSGRPPATKETEINYPTAWSEWEERKDLLRWARYRKTGPGADDYEYEYHPPYEEASTTAQNPVPSSGVAFSSVPQVAQNWNLEQSQARGRSGSTTQENYGRSNVDAVTSQLARSTIISSDPARPQGQGPGYSYNRNPSTAGPSSGYPAAAQSTPARLEPARWVRTVDRRTKVDELDKNFKVHKSKEFEFGRVFKVLWAEPKGTTGTEITRPQGKFGEQAFQKIRRFLVVRNEKGHCTCLSILTYGRQGTLKPKVHSGDHAAIYSSNYGEPYILEGEHMFKKPIMMRPDPPHETLDPMSRINYAKVYTVEHNVKVFFIGRIASRHLERVVADYNSTHLPLPEVPQSVASRDDFRYTEGPEPDYVAARGSAPGYSPQPPRQDVGGSFSYARGEGPSTLSPTEEDDQDPESDDDDEPEAPAYAQSSQQTSAEAQESTSDYAEKPYDSSLYDA